MVLTLIQNVALLVLLAAAQRTLASALVARPRVAAVASGVLYGAAAVAGMLTPFRYVPGIIYDGRSIIMSLAGLFGGWPVALIAAAVAAPYRVFLGGPGAVAGVATIVVTALIGVAFNHLRGRRPSAMRTGELLVFGFVVHLAMMAVQLLLLPDGRGVTIVREIGPIVLTLFPFGTALAARLIIEQQERDVTRRQLIRNEERLRLAMTVSDQGTWDYEIRDSVLRLSPEASVVLGREARELRFGMPEWRALVHPDDVERFVSAFEAHVRGQAPDVRIRYRVRTADGAYRWVLSVGNVVERDALGRPMTLLGTLADVDAATLSAEAAERRRAEAELLARSSEQLLACRDADCVYRAMEEFFGATFPGHIVVINQLSADGSEVETRSVLGVDSATLRRVETLMRRQLAGSRFRVSEQYREALLSGRVQRFEGGLDEIAAGEIPTRATRSLSRVFGLHEFWALGIADSGRAYAGVQIILRGDGMDVPVGMVEAFAHQCFVTLARIEVVDRLADSEERFRTLVETAPDTIFVETEQRFAYINEAGRRLYGATRTEQLVGTSVLDRYDPRYHSLIRERMAALHVRKERQAAVEEIHLRLDGTEVYTEVTAMPLRYDGQDGALVFVRDVTESKRAARELERYRDHLEELVAERTRELEAANAGLERATRAKSEFLAKMSHELRTPLNSIIGFSTILMQGLSGPLDEEQQRQVGIINSSGRHLLTIISDILDLSRIEAGRTELDLCEVEPVTVLEEVAEVLRPLADERGLALQVSGSAEILPILTDRGKLRQILLNLGGNAVKFTDTGLVELALLQHSDGGVLFSVRDTGRGIRADLLERIFESFSQGEALPDEVATGTGLGLTISREYARMLGGEVEVTSQDGSGSTFTLRLPARAPAA